MGNEEKDMNFYESGFEDIDGALFRWVDKELNLYTRTNEGFKKVPVMWVGSERSFASKDLLIRDINDSLTYPLIAIERRGIVKDPTFKGTIWANVPPPILDKAGGVVSISKKINQNKTQNFANAYSRRRYNKETFPFKNERVVYKTTTIPLPVYATIEYHLTIRTEYIQQMNDCLQPFITRPGAINYVILESDKKALRYEAFIEGEFEQDNNIDSMNNEERRFETVVKIKVLGIFINDGVNHEKAKTTVRENAVELSWPKKGINIISSSADVEKLPKKIRDLFNY